jgi:large subunit ribosomal protein L13
MTTHFEKNIDQNDKQWFLFDAKGQVLGRLATQIATILVGKHKPNYTPHADTGDFVVVVNAKEIALTGKKWSGKMYYDHSGYVGGLKEKTATELMEKHPEELIKRAVWGMLHKSKQARHQLNKLKVYNEAEHPHSAQNPKSWEAPKTDLLKAVRASLSKKKSK